jgi:PLAT/LH2 domain
MPTYRVVVYTGNLSPGAFAGTDANVYITLYGSRRSSDELMLDNAANNFEQGAVDTFALHLAELGDLRKVKIRHDNSGLGPGWFLDRVEIRNEDTDDEWTFPCSRWLARDEDDGEIERELDAA